MIVYKRLKIKNCPAFIFGYMVNIKDIALSTIGVNKISITDYEIEYYGNLIYDLVPLYLTFNAVVPCILVPCILFLMM